MAGRISLHDLKGKRLCQNAKPSDITLVKRVTLIFKAIKKKNGIPPTPEGVGFLPYFL